MPINTKQIHKEIEIGNQSLVGSQLPNNTSLSSRLTALGNGANILLLKGTITENVTISQNETRINGEGYQAVISGNVTISGNMNILKDLKINGNLTITGNFNTLENVQITGTLTDNGTGNKLNVIVGT